MSARSQLIVKNFGPIRDISVEFNRFTFFVGSQGTGKSTIAKLFSMFMWLEKRLIRGMISKKYIEQYSRFRKTYCGYHRLSSYFYDDTEIDFCGQAYRFTFKQGKISITELNIDSADVVKVMYIPAERNFLSSIGNLSGIRTLPESLLTFKDEYESATKSFASGYRLPINGVNFEYDRLNNVSWLVGTDFKVRLTDASSGFQAVLPMLLVSQYLTDLVAIRPTGETALNVQELSKLKEEVSKVIANPLLSTEVREAALAALSARFIYSGFINIVEEPEENLYPDSQKEVLYSLLSLANRQPANQLVITTHSPYLINYLTIAIKAGQLISKGADPEAIRSLVPSTSTVSAEEVSIYELSDGKATLLSMPEGIPSDSNFLNLALRETNNTFENLLDIEDSI